VSEFRGLRRAWIVEAGKVDATVPMWMSRPGWLTELSAWSRTVGAAVLRRYHLSPALFARIVKALAAVADSNTGRHCAATNSEIAKRANCGRRVITSARAILAESGFGIEVRRGTGGEDSPSYKWRPSLWHLISRRGADVPNQPVCDLPSSCNCEHQSSVGNQSPNEATSASRQDHRPKRRTKRRPRPPRPLHTQKMAACLAANSVGLGAQLGHHVTGQICDALERSHLDLPAWTGPGLVNALNTDMRTRGLNWPDHIKRPGPFLAGRLPHLPQRPARAPASSTQQPADRHASHRPHPPRAQEPSAVQRASLGAIQAILARSRANLTIANLDVLKKQALKRA